MAEVTPIRPGATVSILRRSAAALPVGAWKSLVERLEAHRRQTADG